MKREQVVKAESLTIATRQKCVTSTDISCTSQSPRRPQNLQILVLRHKEPPPPRPPPLLHQKMLQTVETAHFPVDSNESIKYNTMHLFEEKN